MSITAVAPWYGSNRMGGHFVGEETAGCEWAGVTCCGGMSELKWFTARTIVVNDIHRDVINLARSIQGNCAWMVEQLDGLPFHPDVLAAAQRYCIEQPLPPVVGSVDWQRAVQYFICCWMGRSGIAGTDGEFKGGLPLRWNAGGGDSNVRYRSAVAEIENFHQIATRCTFTVMDMLEMLAECHDKPKHVIYTDLPFPDEGGAYKIKATEQLHRDAAVAHSRFKQTRVVIRYYDCPLIRELYQMDRWTWRFLTGRDQANNATKPEVLIINGPSYATT